MSKLVWQFGDLVEVADNYNGPHADVGDLHMLQAQLIRQVLDQAPRSYIAVRATYTPNIGYWAQRTPTETLMRLIAKIDAYLASQLN